MQLFPLNWIRNATRQESTVLWCTIGDNSRKLLHLSDARNCDNWLERVIGRLGYAITAWNLSKDGKCEHCQTPCSGVFVSRRGNWGSRRMPIRLRDHA